jgi:glyoxylase-like metal-dependent hydrolase (beta-lactamase superfamily II)
VHLDHAGGAGQLMARFPNAQLTVHPRGARHIADPSRLLAATVAIYGEAETRRVYGEVLPVPKERMLETPEGTTLRLAGRELLCLDAPGHARHHVVLRDGKTGHFFAGDTFGLSYRELDRDGRQFSFPTTSPSQFDPPALHRSIDRMLSHGPGALYVTHFGRLTNLTVLAADLHRLIDEHAALGERHRGAGAERKRLLTEGVTSLVLAERERQGWRLPREKVLEIFALDIELNAQGLESWLAAEGK